MAKRRNNNKPYRPQGPPPGKPQGGLLARLLAENGGNASSRGTAGAFAHHTGYSLAEEARNTAYNRRGIRGIDAKLRYQPVTFVSAGFMDPLKDLEVEQRQERLNHPNQVNQVNEAQKAPSPLVTLADVDAPDPIPCQAVKAHNIAAEEPSAPSFTLDLTGDKSLRPNQKPVSGAPSVSKPNYESDSSEEVILFKGRDPSRQNRSPAEPSQDVADQYTKKTNKAKDTLEFREMNLELRVVEKSIPQKKFKSPEAQQIMPSIAPQQEVVTKTNDNDYLSLSTTKKGGKKRRNTTRKTSGKATQIEPQSPVDDEEAAIVADYIANMRDDTDEDEAASGGDQPSVVTHAFNVLRDLGGTDSDAIPKDIPSEEDSSDASSRGANDDGSDRRRRLELEDEQLARRLAKQEELGFGADEAFLLDDADSDDDEDDWQLASKTSPRRKKKGSSKQARITQRKGQYPSATEMADAFDDLDLVMDWHRPSLNNFKKQPKSFDISDSELEEAMNRTFQKDRQKKAEQKRAREELRSQGLLGKNVNPDNLKVKYRGGMSLDDLANELEAFLLGSQQQ